MQLSILIPVYNVAAYLPSLLQKLLIDLPEDIEFIFYDDASTDDSLLQIQQFKKDYSYIPVRIIHGLANIGLTFARNKLLKAANSDYIWFIDADDIVESDYFKNILFILKDNKPDVLLFSYDVFYDKSLKIKSKEILSYCPKNTLVHCSSKQIYQTAIFDGKHYFWNKIFRRELIKDAVEYKIPAFEDIAYTPILLNHCKSFYYLNKTIIHYRIRSNSIAQKMDIRQAYGIYAYISQASYASSVVNDEKSQAYLLYKACIYYFRISSKIEKADIPANTKEKISKLSQRFFYLKKISTWKIVRLLFCYGMPEKAVKLICKKIFFDVNKYFSI